MNRIPTPPTGNQESVNAFWQALIAAGKEVLAEGLRYGYGFSNLEVKFSDGTPSIMIRSHTQSVQYSSGQQAVADLTEIITRSRSAGSQSFTIIRGEKGEITRVLLDEYITDRLK